MSGLLTRGMGSAAKLEAARDALLAEVRELPEAVIAWKPAAIPAGGGSQRRS
jgi:hypothetical protein